MEKDNTGLRSRNLDLVALTLTCAEQDVGGQGQADPALHSDMGQGTGDTGPPPHRAGHRQVSSTQWNRKLSPRGGADGWPSEQSDPGSEQLGTRERYLRLLLLPGLLSNFLLSRGNLSPAMSNIFSASWKERGRYYRPL